MRRARKSASRAARTLTVQISLAAHAPYSVVPGAAGGDSGRSGCGRRWRIERAPGGVARRGRVHRARGGRLAGFPAGACVWNDAWRPPGVSPVDYLVDCGFLDSRVLAVHGVQCFGSVSPACGRLGHDRVVPPEQPVRRGRRSSARGLLCDGRACGVWDRQPWRASRISTCLLSSRRRGGSRHASRRATSLKAHAPRCPCARVRRLRQPRAGRAGGADRRPAAGGNRRCGGIPGVRCEPESIQWLDSADLPVASRPVAHG